MRARHRHTRNFGIARPTVAARHNGIVPPPKAGWKSKALLAVLAAGAIATIVWAVWLGTLFTVLVRTLFDFSHFRRAGAMESAPRARSSYLGFLRTETVSRR